MNLRGAGLERKAPITRPSRKTRALDSYATVRGHIEGKESTHAVVFAAKQSEQVGQRNFLPMNMDLRGLKARGSACHVAINRQYAGGLEGHTAAPRLRFQPHLPSSRGNLLDASGNAQKGEG